MVKLCLYFYCNATGIKIKFHLGRTKGWGEGGYGGEAQNEGYFHKIPIIKQDTNFISQSIGQTNF